jgi:hypothetical protein
MLGVPAYRALILNNQTTITVAAVDKITEMALSGLPVIFVGQPPERTYPATKVEQAGFAIAMKRLLSAKHVFHADSEDLLPSILAKLSIFPRVSLKCSTNPVYSVWRSSQDIDFLYFFNDQNAATHCDVEIAAKGVTPYTYNSWTGNRLPFFQYKTTNSGVKLLLSFQSNETMILALHRTPGPTKCSISEASVPISSVSLEGERLLVTVTGPTDLVTSMGKAYSFSPSLEITTTNLTAWDLVIEDWHSAPDRYAVQTEIRRQTFKAVSLKPWSELDSSLENVSGVGHYTSSFAVPHFRGNETLAAILHLPPIQNTVRVYLDGHRLPPVDPVNPKIDLTGMVKRGMSYTIEVEVTTTLFNRVKNEADDIFIVGSSASTLQPSYKNMSYEKYGLTGSVWIQWGVIVEVDC